MFRLTIVSALGLVAVIAANAGSIEIGGVTGLTNAYLTTAGGGVNCAAGVGACITGSTGGESLQNYDTVLFAGATNGTAPVPFSGYTQNTGTAAGLTATSASNGTSAGGITFAMVSDGLNGVNSRNFWESNGDETITVPIGIFDVTDVATMLQNIAGSLGGNDTTVTFNFGSTSNATSGLTSVAVNLADVNNAGAGEIRAGVLCNTTTTATCNTTTNPQGVPVTVTPNVGGSGITVDTSSVFGGPSTFGGTYAYTSISPNTGFYANTQGHLKLDDQDFIFGSTFSNKWLVSVQVTENSGDTSFLSQTALSAITVDTATPTPEPTTILLVLAGLGGIGLARRFSRA
jgi:hypothetical protein